MKTRDAIFIHDAVNVMFLLPFAFMCLMEVVFHYTIHPLFLTYALISHMSYDLLWIYLQPQIITSFRRLIVIHHLTALSLLVYPLLDPQDARLTAISGIIEFDTSLLLLRRIYNGNKRMYDKFNRMYLISNMVLRVYYESLLTVTFWYYFEYANFWVRLHIMSGQVFINLFSYGICIRNQLKRVRA